MRLAADAGLAEAQYNLANMYIRGEGVPRGDTAAFEWLRHAAEQGFVDAQNNLGVAYENGIGVTTDMTAAAKWYRLAAEAGQARAQYSLGMMQAAMAREPAALVEAYAWCGVSAARGLTTAVTCYRAIERRLDAAGRAAARQRTAEYRERFAPPTADSAGGQASDSSRP